MSFYTDMQDVAAELLTEFGATGTLTKSAVATSVPARPWETSPVAIETQEVITCAAVPVTERSDQVMLDSIEAYSDARWILVAAKGMGNDVLPGDKVTVVGQDWKIVKVTKIQPASEVVMYSCVGVC